MNGTERRRDLAGFGLKLYAVTASNHDFLWFSSLEISKVAATAPIIHNYALSYALNGFSYGIGTRSHPTYEEDLQQMLSQSGAYATPATPIGRVRSTRFTQNALDSVTLMTAAPSGRNSPALGYRIVLNPMLEPDRGFSFYLFAHSEFKVPPVVRLGKKGCPIRLNWQELDSASAVLNDSATQPTHAVNPLDVTGKILCGKPISIPPHMLFEYCEIQESWFVFSDRHRVLVPKRIQQIMETN